MEKYTGLSDMTVTLCKPFPDTPEMDLLKKQGPYQIVPQKINLFRTVFKSVPSKKWNMLTQLQSYHLSLK